MPKIPANPIRTIFPLCKQWTTLALLPFLVTIIAIACTLPIQLPTTDTQATETPVSSQTTPEPQATPLMVAELTFVANIPEGTGEDPKVFVNILDEVSGLAINARSYEMELDEGRQYSLTLPFSFGTVVKYRYSHQGESAMLEEHISDGRQLRYRMYRVEGPGVVQDVVTRWTDTKYTGPTGRINGRALDAVTGQPIANLLVIAGGAPTFTTSDGTYLIEGLPPGTHNLVGYALDGSYHTFQQGAVVAAESTTPAELRLQPAAYVNITFELEVPEGTIPAVPIRVAGSLYQLGNTFADLAGGLSTLASRMPVLSSQADGIYRMKISLPVGADIRYLYTLGDGFWNTEVFENGDHRLRQFIVPSQDAVIKDSVEAWSSGNSAPITFDITIPPETPAEDYISIQFNPVYGWTEPIPMWRLSATRWAYVLNQPLETISSLHYRFCRSDQCGAADDAASSGQAATGYPLNTSLFKQTMADEVSSWNWLNLTAPEMTAAPAEVTPRGSGFSAGIEYQASYHPSWSPRYPQTLDAIQSLGANWIIFSPTWTYTRHSPPILEMVTGRDANWLDLQQMILQTRARNLSVAVFPTPHFPDTYANWWQQGQHDFSWWVVWFDRYRTFTLHHADLAARSDAQALILGGDWLAPALPGGLLPDGTPSGVPADAEERWRNLLTEIRQRFGGTIAWAIPYSQIQQSTPPFLDAIDSIYVLMDAPLGSPPNPTRADMAVEAGKALDGVVGPLQQRFNKPIILGVAYPSADGSASACLPSSTGGCLPLSSLDRPNADIPGLLVDMGEQEEIYAAILDAINARQWIYGFISRGYYPPAALQDYSASIHGKNAQELLRYWYPRLLAPVP